MGYGLLAWACFFLMFPIFINVGTVNSQGIFGVLSYLLMFMGFYQVQRRIHNRFIQVGFICSIVALFGYFMNEYVSMELLAFLCEMLLVVCMLLGVIKRCNDALQKKIKHCLWLYGITCALLCLLYIKPKFLFETDIIWLVMLLRLIVCLKLVSRCKDINRELEEVTIGQYHQKQIPVNKRNTILMVLVLCGSLLVLYGSQTWMELAIANQNDDRRNHVLYQSEVKEHGFLAGLGNISQVNEQSRFYDIMFARFYLQDETIAKAAKQIQIFRNGNRLFSDKQSIQMIEQAGWWYVANDNGIIHGTYFENEEAAFTFQVVLYDAQDAVLYDQTFPFTLQPVKETTYHGSGDGVTIQDMKVQGTNIMDAGSLRIAMWKMMQYEDIRELGVQLVFYQGEKEVTRSETQWHELLQYQHVYRGDWHLSSEDEVKYPNPKFDGLYVSYDRVEVNLIKCDLSGNCTSVQFPLEPVS